MATAHPTTRVLCFQIHHFPHFPPTRSHSISEAAGTRWVTFNGESSNIRPDAAVAHYNDWVDEEADAVPESFRRAEWSGRNKDYLAYGIDMGRIRQLTGPSVEAPDFLDPHDPTSIHPGLALKVIRDLKIAKEMLEFLDERGGWRGGGVDRVFSGESLVIASGEEVVVAELRRARRIMDERLAAVNFGALRSEPGVRSYFERTYSAYISKWGLLDCIRGLYVDFRFFNPDVTPLLDFIQAGVPVSYPLDDEFRPRFDEREMHAAEAVENAVDFGFWLANDACRPETVKRLTAPTKLYGATPSLNARFPDRYPGWAARLTLLTEHSRPILADLLHPNLAPVVPVLAGSTIVVTQEARLIVDPLVELRMMLWAIRGRITEVDEILSEALLRGWAFQLVFPQTHLAELRDPGPEEAAAASEAAGVLFIYTDSDVPEVQLKWVRFLERALQLLSRPNARAFLTLGGIFWRLAILLGGRFLESWKLNILGPSSGVIIGHSGNTTVLGYRGNDVTEAEKNALLGLTRSRTTGTSRYWFPPEDLLIRHRFYDGEWSNVAARLVMDRYESLQRGETTYSPLTLEEWDQLLATYHPGKLLRESLVFPPRVSTESLLLDTRNKIGGSWNMVTLSELGASLRF
ncbi:hypothetical protein BC629DRAFT_1443367 [Irpex lacteus]|nr:hypothetical protein BC629DRAFT_1443367 [Irpex lacteus]